ncbi:hypothetical protein GpartN1_g6206.t1 [Galdieria partita]|uniref:DEP domain-containing protein n=1 Tax=Galdieria partita TaxID=83374 RepID=A0A9C7Q1Z9_9RHOD|nr:hypothetical protein GpartN1_g6206.t1 [Galdieria partita]
MQLTLDLSLIVAICTTIYLMGFSLGTSSSRSLENWTIYVSLLIFTGVLIFRICRWKQLCQLEKNGDSLERELTWESLAGKPYEEDRYGENEEKVEQNAESWQAEERPSFLEEIFQRVLRVAEGWLEDDVKQKLQDCLEEGFLDFALSENNRFSSDWSLQKVKLQLGDQKPLIRNYEFDEQLLERNNSDERVLSLQSVVSVYFKSFMKLSLVRKVAVVDNKIILLSPTSGEQEACGITLHVTVKDVAIDTRIEAELLPEYPFLGSISFCILEPVNFNIDFHISTDSEVSFLTSSSEDENTVSSDFFKEDNLNQLLFHFIDEAVFRYIAYPNVRTIHFPEANIEQPKTELTINTTDVSKPLVEQRTTDGMESFESDNLVELHLIEGFLSFKEPCDEATRFSTGQVGVYVKLKNFNDAVIFTSSIAYCNKNMEWKHVWKIPVIHFQNGCILLEVFLGNMQSDDIYLGRLHLSYNKTFEETEKWYSVKEELKSNIDVLKLRVLMRLLSPPENEESVVYSSNVNSPVVPAEVTEQQPPKLRRFSSTGSASQEGSESMLKRLGKKLLFQRYSLEVTTHDWSLECILLHMRTMISKEQGVSRRFDTEGSKGINFSSLSMTSKRSDDIYTFSGSDAVEWLLTNSRNKISSRNEAVEILKTCHDLGIFLAVDGHLRRHHIFVDSSTSKYSFSPFYRKSVEQSEGRSHACVLNQGQILVFSTNSLLTGSIEFPMLKASQPVLGLGEKLVLHVAELFKKQSFGLDELVFIPKLEPKYFRFLRTCRKLQYISYDVLRSMSSVEKICFFINVYNALFLHSLIVSGIPKGLIGSEEASDSYLEANVLFREAICYRIGMTKDKETHSNLIFSLNDILHGILRCNRTPSSCCQDWVDYRTSVDSTCKKHASEEDPSCSVYFPLKDIRAALSVKMVDFDPRVHFLLLNYPSLQPRVLYLCKPSNLNLLLNEATCSVCEENVDVNEGKKTVSLPCIFRNHIEDFLPPEVYGDASGGMDINAAYELLRVAAEFLPNDSEKKVALSRLLVSCLDSDKSGSDQLLADCVHLFFENPRGDERRNMPFVTFSKELAQELEISK